MNGGAVCCNRKTKCMYQYLVVKEAVRSQPYQHRNFDPKWLLQGYHGEVAHNKQGKNQTLLNIKVYSV